MVPRREDNGVVVAGDAWGAAPTWPVVSVSWWYLGGVSAWSSVWSSVCRSLSVVGCRSAEAAMVLGRVDCLSRPLSLVVARIPFPVGLCGPIPAFSLRDLSCLRVSPSEGSCTL